MGLLDNLIRRFNPNFLRRGQVGQVDGKIYVGLVHRLPDVKKPYWKIVHYANLLQGTQLRYLGQVKKLRFSGDPQPNDYMFEIVWPNIESDPINPKQVNTGDTICVAVSDRQYIHPYI